MADPYYQDDWVTLYHGDCRQLVASLAGPQVSVVTDPPYNAGKDYGGHDDNMADAAYVAWCHEWFEPLRACLEVAVFPGINNLRTWLVEFRPQSIGSWCKEFGWRGMGHAGLCGWEPWLYWGKRRGADKSNTYHSNVQIRDGLDYGHPVPKPLGLMHQMVRDTRPDQIILDPFAGSGTTLRAAADLGRRAIGIELNEAYCETIARRLSQGAFDFDGAA